MNYQPWNILKEATYSELFEDQMESYLDEFLIQTKERFRIPDLIHRFDTVLFNRTEWTSQVLDSSSELYFRLTGVFMTNEKGYRLNLNQT